MSQSILGAGYTYDNNILYQAIETNSVRNYVVSRQVKFSKMLNIFDKLNGYNATSTRTDAREFKQPYLGDTSPYGVIKTGGRTQVTTSLLKLYLTDESYDDFITDHILESSTGVMGLIVAHEPGMVTVKFYYAPTGATAFVAADFAAGTQVTEGTDVSKGVTDAKESRKYVPNYDTNVVGQQTYTYEVTREDMSRKTVVTTGSGDEYWQHAGWDLFMQRDVVDKKAWGVWKGPRVTTTDQWNSGGIKWQIENQGGMQDTYNGTLTEQKLLQLAEMVHERGTGTTEFYVPCGSRLLSGFQYTAGNKYIQYAGTQNTIGGTEVKGINVETFKVLGIDFKFDVWAMLNNPRLNPEGQSAITGQLKSSYTGIFLDTSMIPTIGHGLKPFITPYYYGPEATGATIIEGTTDLMGNYLKKGNNAKNACLVQIQSNELYQLNDPTRHILLNISQ